MITAKSAESIIRAPTKMRPHVVVLGAGASRAAFPNGDAAGRKLPVMNDLVDTLSLRELLTSSAPHLADEHNFEAVYSTLHEDPAQHETIRQIERRVQDYFEGLQLPTAATIYDRLLLALRHGDAILSFNWDPFLFDAYERNRSEIGLPAIYFLHGNVRTGVCEVHGTWGARRDRCPTCGSRFVDTRLLYPIRRKDYSSDPHILATWQAASAMVAEAFTVTMFGYGAPSSDEDAVTLLREAWLSRSTRTLEHIEIIDVAEESELTRRWREFSPTLHLNVRRSFHESRLSRWPRRSCESLLSPMTEGVPCEDFPLPCADDLGALRAYCQGIASHESDITAIE